MSKEPSKTLEVVYTWPDSSEEVMYRRDHPSSESEMMIKEVDDLKAKLPISRYSYRIV